MPPVDKWNETEMEMEIEVELNQKNPFLPFNSARLVPDIFRHCRQYFINGGIDFGDALKS